MRSTGIRRGTAAGLALFAAWLLAIPSSAHAWGADGHQLIAREAQRLLTPTARSAVAELLALEPGATLATIATWADEARSPATAKWHYVNFPQESGCVYEARRDCTGGACIVGAIERQTAILASSASDAVRLRALKYVVHFVGDVHQPLHAGLATDKGGNKFQVQFLGRGSNLHSVWDSRMLHAWPGGVDSLQMNVRTVAASANVPSFFNPAQWAEESCRVVNAPGFYPRRRGVGDAYVQQMTPMVVQRLAEASIRLAAVLNKALGR